MKKKSRRRKQPRTGEQSERRFFNLLRQGTRALHDGELDKAIQLLERARQLDLENVDAALNLSGAFILSKKHAQALSILEPLSEREPDNPMVWTNLGAAYLGNPVLARDQDQRRAIAAFEQAIELNPVAPHVAYNLGLIYRDRKESTEALYWFRRAVQADPNDQDARRYVERLTQALEEENGKG
jgi:tetratricopeptide (TPR) repeat protein